jgi:hypothetical protein
MQPGRVNAAKLFYVLSGIIPDKVWKMISRLGEEDKWGLTAAE